MKVELVKYPTESDWMLVKDCALVTVGKRAVNPPTTQWKIDILKARHSPIRELKFVFRMTDIPSWVATHLARHKHAQPYIKTQRNDRQEKYDRNKAPQGELVDMYYSVNAEELMTIANKRLCFQASPETRLLVGMMCYEAKQVMPEISEFLCPMCIYHGGVCHEMNPCGR